MRKTILFTTLIIAVLVAAIFVLSNSHSPFGKSNSEFASKPVTEITRIKFSQNGKDLTLEKAGEEWLINGEIKARKGGINFIIRILTEARIKSPVSPELFRSEITDKGIDPVNVQVYEGRKMLKSFMVYKTGSNIYGNIMKMRQRAKPFIVNVPGYEVNIGYAFTLKEQYWEPYTIFNMLPSEINSVRFENRGDSASSFRISKKDGKYTLSGNNNDLTGWNPELIIRYISYFTFVPFESWAVDMTNEEKLSIDIKEPDYRITVVSSTGSATILNLWERIKTENGKKVTDSDRLIGKIKGNDDFFIVRYFDIDPVLKKRAYFFSVQN
jgi:hypothetical protein